MTYRIKNFEKFQHFKDRSPPWIKLYRDILDDPDWHELDPEAAKVLVMLWLIASEDETKQGNLPEMKKLAFRLRIEQKRLEKLCIKLSHWLEQVDINAISDGYQSDAPETETETETYKPETEKDSRAPRFDAQSHLVELGVPPLIAGDWITLRKSKKAPVTQTAIRGVEQEAGKAGISIAEAMATCCQRGWAGFKADWIAGDNPRNGKTQYQINQDATAHAFFGNSSPKEPRLIPGEVVA